MQCRECHAELPQGARRCPQCGRPVLHEKIWNNKRLRALLIGITIVLIAVGAGFAVVASHPTFWRSARRARLLRSLTRSTNDIPSSCKQEQEKWSPGASLRGIFCVEPYRLGE